MSDNLSLWNQLCRTDPKATKTFQRSGFKGTQIDPVWRYQKMTEAFGPIGKGWGYEHVGAPIITDGMVFVCVQAWWRDADGKQHWTGPQWGGDVLFKPRREGNPVPNDEALKMATTDAVGKALVLLGLGADVHMGQFDDSKYREEVNREYRAKENGNGKAAPPKAAPKMTGRQWIERQRERLDGFASPDDVQSWMTDNKDRLDALPEAAREDLMAYANAAWRRLQSAGGNTVLGGG